MDLAQPQKHTWLETAILVVGVGVRLGIDLRG